VEVSATSRRREAADGDMLRILAGVRSGVRGGLPRNEVADVSSQKSPENKEKKSDKKAAAERAKPLLTSTRSRKLLSEQPDFLN
jgi:hypothetical protein